MVIERIYLEKSGCFLIVNIFSASSQNNVEGVNASFHKQEEFQQQLSSFRFMKPYFSNHPTV